MALLLSSSLAPDFANRDAWLNAASRRRGLSRNLIWIKQRVFAISFYLVHDRVRFRKSFRINPPLLRATISDGRNSLDSLARPRKERPRRGYAVFLDLL